MRSPSRTSIWRHLRNRIIVVTTAPVLTTACFLVLPLIESIGGGQVADTVVRSVDEVNLPPPPPPPEPEPEKEPEPEDKPPDLAEDVPPMDLSQLELALSGGVGDGFGVGADIRIDAMSAGAAADSDAQFDEGELEQKARPVYQASPVLTPELRRKTPGAVHLVFTVDANGRVLAPQVFKSTDAAFERAALAAIREWRFEPGQRNGKPVRSRARVTITFPKS